MPQWKSVQTIESKLLKVPTDKQAYPIDLKGHVTV